MSRTRRPGQASTPRGHGRLRRRGQSSGWQDGWWRGAQAVPSPNFGPRPVGVVPSLVVLHSISLPPGRVHGPAVEELFTNTLDCARHPYFAALQGVQVSAHFFVRRDGRVLQFVATRARAWHAGSSVWRGRPNCNDWSIGIEIEGLEGRRFAARQYRVLARLLRAIVSVHPIVEVVGHEHVAPGRKADPGAGFDWLRLSSLLRGCETRLWPLLNNSA